MSTATLERLSRDLSGLGSLSRRRALKAPAGVDFASNDYLGFSRHPALIQALKEAADRLGRVGSGGSRLLRGNHPEHEALEEAAALFFRSESALYFGSGFDANLALFSALPSRRGALILDERVHASVKEGARASFARKYAARHNDPRSFESALRRARRLGARDVFIAVESAYSMDGDKAPLGDILALARRHEATIIVDEAHATGIFGPTGRGLTESIRDSSLIALHTCGKALGVSGAFVVGSRVVKDYLINAARPFVYSTAPSPVLAAVVRRALALVDEEPWRRRKLLALIPKARSLIEGSLSRWKLGGDGTQILPVLVGADARAVRTAEHLEKRGLDARAIRPPTVPAGQCRLRLSLNADLTDDHLRRLAEALAEAERHG